MMGNLTEREMDKLIETLTIYSEDEGPNAGGGWKSDELKQLINKIEKLRITKPAPCPKAYNPYTYCPLMFEVSNEMIDKYVSTLIVEVKRLNGLPMQIKQHEYGVVDRYCGEITAYMNGRLHEALNYAKEEEK